MANATKAKPKAKLREELLELEREYLRAVQAKDAGAAARLTSPEALVVSGRGAMKVDRAMIGNMVAEHDATQEYELDDASAEIVEVGDGVAIVSYRLTTTVAGKSSDSYDTDVWVRAHGQWTCSLHAETAAVAEPGPA